MCPLAAQRTINIFTPNTEEGLKKFDEELQLVHDAFIAHVTEHRPAIDAQQVCTGETWLGQYALPLGLVDELQTSECAAASASNPLVSCARGL